MIIFQHLLFYYREEQVENLDSHFILDCGEMDFYIPYIKVFNFAPEKIQFYTSKIPMESIE